MAKKSVLVVVSGITLYLLFPSLAAVFDAFPKLTSLDPIWFTLALALQVAHFTCTIALQRIALRTDGLVLGHDLAAVRQRHQSDRPRGRRLRGGDTVPDARRRRERSGDRGGGTDGLLAAGYRRAARPPDLRAARHFRRHPDRERPAARGAARPGAFVLFAGFGALVLTLDGPLRWAGHVIQAARNRLKRKAEPMTGWRTGSSSSATASGRARPAVEGGAAFDSGRLAFDFGTLLATIRATGVKPNPSLVLLAYAVAGLLALIPITPGGLGIVEAGLSALLILAGVPGGDAVVATLAYRIISYWLPISWAPFAYFAFRLRYGNPGARRGGRMRWRGRWRSGDGPGRGLRG